MSDFHTSEGPNCPVTDRTDVIDDCYITVEFGYGSDKDMWTYNFNTVHDSVGKKVLEAIQSMMPKDRSVEDFGRDTLEGEFDPNWKPTQQQKAEWGW